MYLASQENSHSLPKSDDLLSRYQKIDARLSLPSALKSEMNGLILKIKEEPVAKSPGINVGNLDKDYSKKYSEYSQAFDNYIREFDSVRQDLINKLEKVLSWLESIPSERAKDISYNPMISPPTLTLKGTKIVENSIALGVMREIYKNENSLPEMLSNIHESFRRLLSVKDLDKSATIVFTSRVSEEQVQGNGQTVNERLELMQRKICGLLNSPAGDAEKLAEFRKILADSGIKDKGIADLSSSEFETLCKTISKSKLKVNFQSELIIPTLNDVRAFYKNNVPKNVVSTIKEMSGIDFASAPYSTQFFVGTGSVPQELKQFYDHLRETQYSFVTSNVTGKDTSITWPPDIPKVSAPPIPPYVMEGFGMNWGYAVGQAYFSKGNNFGDWGMGMVGDFSLVPFHFTDARVKGGVLKKEYVGPYISLEAGMSNYAVVGAGLSYKNGPFAVLAGWELTLGRSPQYDPKVGDYVHDMDNPESTGYTSPMVKVIWKGWTFKAEANPIAGQTSYGVSITVPLLRMDAKNNTFSLMMGYGTPVNYTTVHTNSQDEKIFESGPKTQWKFGVSMTFPFY